MKPAVFSVLLLPLVSLVAGQFTVPPPTDAPEDTIQDCTNWHVGASGETCENLAEWNLLTLDQLYRYNPSLRNGCNIQAGTSYCVEENWGIPPEEPSTTTTTTSPTTTGIVTPSPTMPPRIVEGCTQFHFVQTGTSCSSILAQFGLTIAQFYAWNSGVGADCSGLWTGVYVCVAGPGGSQPPTTTTTTPNPTSTGTNGVATPSPTQPGAITPNCNKFYFVESGTSCSVVLSQNGITIAQLYAWNSGVGPDCSGMWANVHLCVGVIGGSPTTTTTATTTTSGNGVSTPTPTQPGIGTNCNKFYFVNQGTSCNTVLSQNGLTLAQFYALNPGVLADCSGMWGNVYVCVGAIGGTTPTTTTRSTTTTGGGTSTPTPTQPGMINSCTQFHFVATGQSCQNVLTQYGLSLAQFHAWNSGVRADCSGMWVNVYVCVKATTGIIPTTTTTLRTTTTTGNGIATPTPTQPGMVANCNRFYKVVDGDTCATISSKTGVSTSNILAWNRELGSSCNVWLGYYICIGVR